MNTKLEKSLVDFLEAKNFGHLATIMKDGSPQVTPVWVDYDGEFILVNTAVGRVKHKNILRDPRIALSIQDENNPYRMISVRGRVVAMTTEGALEHIDKLSKKYVGRERYPRLQETRIILKINADRVVIKA